MGPVDPEVTLLNLKKKEIVEGKIYSPVGKFAEGAKVEMHSRTYRVAHPALQCCLLETLINTPDH